MIPLRSLFLVYLILGLLFPAWITANQEQAKPKPQGTQDALLWRIDHAGQTERARSSYLLGTIHSGDERVLTLPAPVKRAFERSDYFVAEIMMEPEMLMQANMAMFLSGEETLEQMVSASLFKQCVVLLKDYGVPEYLVKKMKPWAVAVTLSMPKGSGQFLDLVLYQQAKAEGKQLAGLETVAEQMALFDDLALSLQITMLEDAVLNFADAHNMIQLLTDAYLARKLSEIEKLSYAYMEKGDKKLIEFMENNIITKRNHRMLKSMLPVLEKGKAFIAVGALHLPGQEGLLNLLKAEGFQLVPIY